MAVPPLETALRMNAGETWYLCGDNFWGEILAEYKRPGWLPGASNGSLAFGVGRTGSGIPLHRHGGALLEVTAGRKRWFVAPPFGGSSQVLVRSVTGKANDHDEKAAPTNRTSARTSFSADKWKGARDRMLSLAPAASTTRTGQEPIKNSFPTSPAAKDGDPPFDPEKASFNWFHDGEDILSPQIQMCTQNTGEALWLPDNWWHSTLNVGECVFWLLFT